MEQITSLSEHVSDNRIIADAQKSSMDGSKIIFNGSGNILVVEDGVKLSSSTVLFNGSNAVCYLGANKNPYYVNLTVNNNSCIFFGRGNYINGKMTDQPIAQIMTEPLFVYQHTKIRDILKMLQHQKSHIAVVVDDFGGTLGIVTMEDILEELVGEIWDEHDEEETPISKGSDGTYLVAAEMSFDDFADYFGLRSDSDMASVSGWVMEQFGRLPETGASFDFETLHVQITRIANHHIEQIRVSTAANEPAGSGSETGAAKG